MSDEEILTITELSVHLRVHPTTIYRLLRERRIPGFRVGSAWRFNRSAIERWEQSQDAIVESAHAAPMPPAPKRSKARKPKKK
jgi:excisionase family DNA binding protein